jgi:hypothetical protein
MNETFTQTNLTKKQEGQMGRWAPYYDLLIFFVTLEEKDSPAYDPEALMSAETN